MYSVKIRFFEAMARAARVAKWGALAWIAGSWAVPPDAFSAVDSTTADSEGMKLRRETLFERRDVIWGFDFLPDGRIVFTERGGSLGLYDVKAKEVVVLKGTPSVYAVGQGGMLDVRVLPGGTGKIFFTYSEPVGTGATTSLATATLAGRELKGIKKIFEAKAANDNSIHFGSRIEFDGKGHLFVTVGDRGEREKAQDLGSHQGKVLRLNEDGTAPKDNPFVGVKGALPEIWSRGHRSPQGLVRHPVTGELWQAEMGPRGGDEINLLKKGANYGWPVVTQGNEYSGAPMGVKTKPDMEDPRVFWVPSISPSAMTFYQGEAFPPWKGNVLLATLSGMHLHRVVFEKDRAVKQEELFKGARFRNVRAGPDGYLYLSTDDGRLERIVPVKP